MMCYYAFCYMFIIFNILAVVTSNINTLQFLFLQRLQYPLRHPYNLTVLVMMHDQPHQQLLIIVLQLYLLLCCLILRLLL